MSAPRFLIVVPSYNAMPYLATCLGSIKFQTYRNYQVVVVDDASTTPGEADFVQDFCDDAGWVALLNETNLKMPRNLRLATRLAGPDPDDVILIVDGDDWLSDNQVLQRLATHYSDPNLWLTWGSYTRWPDPSIMPNPACEWPDEVVRSRTYRNWYGTTPFNHPLAFRAHLWDQVRDADLQDDNGNWFQAGYDAAIMFPMTEMAGPRHSRFIDDVLYTYNENNPLSDGRVRPRDCDYAHIVIRRRPPRDLYTRAKETVG
jgi:glycosyltransferase involved in cell wall biosynthesis